MFPPLLRYITQNTPNPLLVEVPIIKIFLYSEKRNDLILLSVRTDLSQKCQIFLGAKFRWSRFFTILYYKPTILNLQSDILQIVFSVCCKGQEIQPPISKLMQRVATLSSNNALVNQSLQLRASELLSLSRQFAPSFVAQRMNFPVHVMLLDFLDLNTIITNIPAYFICHPVIFTIL